MQQDPGTEGTITDEEWTDLQQRAVKAETRPWHDDEVVKQRLATRAQRDNRKWS